MTKATFAAATFAALAALALGGCATTAESMDADPLGRMMAGESQMQGKALERALQKASAYPLGSNENPVRASMPEGQRAYLRRLRCPDGDPAGFQRAGNLGPGVYGNIVDAYVLNCGEGQQFEVVMDMYHSGYVEDRPVPGFTIVPAE